MGQGSRQPGPGFVDALKEAPDPLLYISRVIRPGRNTLRDLGGTVP